MRLGSGPCKARKGELKPLQPQPYPTVLVARDDDGLDGPLVHCLQRNGFHVLEADDWEHVFDVVRVHSRPIHLLLVDVSMDARVPILKEHRSELQVVFVKKPVDADVVLAKVRQLLGSPPSAVFDSLTGGSRRLSPKNRIERIQIVVPVPSEDGVLFDPITFFTALRSVAG